MAEDPTTPADKTVTSGQAKDTAKPDATTLPTAAASSAPAGPPGTRDTTDADTHLAQAGRHMSAAHATVDAMTQTPGHSKAEIQAAAAPHIGEARKALDTAFDKMIEDMNDKIAKDVGPDPMKELLDRFARDQSKIAGLDRGIGQSVQALVQTGGDPDRRSQIGFRHQVAYAVQDIERVSVGQIPMAPELRREMTQLAGSAPGLENERMLALMRTTASISDRATLHGIREAGAEIGRRTDQEAPDVQSQIDTLENRVRLTTRPPEPPSPTERPEIATRAAATTPPERPVPDGNAPMRPSPNGGAQSPNQTQAPPQSFIGPGTVLDRILGGMRPSGRDAAAPWDPPPTPMAERLSAFEKQMVDGHDERAFERAMKSGRVAVDALQGFDNGEGATIMSRIREAAKTTDGGVPGVLSEMKDGGRFADLRRQFNNALETDLGLARAYDRAAGALERYGADRSGVQDIIGRRPDASAITQRFEKLDAELGEAAAKTPSRNDGNSMMDDLAQKAAEILQRAVAAVKAAFSRSPSPDAGARPSPSMSMGG